MKEIYIQNSHETEARYEFIKRASVHLGQHAVHMAQHELTIEIKPDGSEVTNIDKTLNREFIAMVQATFPDDEVWGEEESTSNNGDLAIAEHAWVWVLDPADGTKKLVEAHAANKLNQCTTTVLAAAFAPGETTPTLSAVYSPFQRKKLLISASPEGVELWTPHTNTSRSLYIKEGPKSLDSVERYEYSSWGHSLRQLDTLMPFARRFRTQVRMASVALGDVDVSVFPAPSHPHDVLPGAHIVHQAGGTVLSLTGEPYEAIDWRVDPLDGVVAARSTELAHDTVEQLAA